eukprot:2290699-Prymnesium_polylepis.1
MLRHACSTALRHRAGTRATVALSPWRGCSSDATANDGITAQEYVRVASLTIDCLQEVYEDYADEAKHQVDVECT